MCRKPCREVCFKILASCSVLIGPLEKVSRQRQVVIPQEVIRQSEKSGSRARSVRNPMHHFLGTSIAEAEYHLFLIGVEIMTLRLSLRNQNLTFDTYWGHSTRLYRNAPCSHPGACDIRADCACFRNNAHCHMGCRCDKKCTRSLFMCHCSHLNENIVRQVIAVKVADVPKGKMSAGQSSVLVSSRTASVTRLCVRNAKQSKRDFELTLSFFNLAIRGIPAKMVAYFDFDGDL